MSEDIQYQTNMTHFHKLIETEQKLGMESTKFLWTFSGAAIGLSITLVSGAFGPFLLHRLEFLIASWALFTLCILLTMFSVNYSQKAFHTEIMAFRAYMENKEDQKSESDRDKFNRRSRCSEILARVLFILGIITMLVFVGYNILIQENNNGTKKGTVKETTSQTESGTSDTQGHSDSSETTQTREIRKEGEIIK